MKKSIAKREEEARKAGLAEWRRENWKRILDLLESRLTAIIQNPESSARDVNEAARTLARMADILSPEKVSSGSASKAVSHPSPLEEDLTPEEREEIERLLGNTQGEKPEVLS